MVSGVCFFRDSSGKLFNMLLATPAVFFEVSNASRQHFQIVLVKPNKPNMGAILQEADVRPSRKEKVGGGVGVTQSTMCEPGVSSNEGLRYWFSFNSRV